MSYSWNNLQWSRNTLSFLNFPRWGWLSKIVLDFEYGSRGYYPSFFATYLGWSSSSSVKGDQPCPCKPHITIINMIIYFYKTIRAWHFILFGVLFMHKPLLIFIIGIQWKLYRLVIYVLHFFHTCILEQTNNQNI